MNAAFAPTSVLCVSFCSWLRIGKKSRFCRERLDLGFCSSKDMLREKTTGSSLSFTGPCKIIQRSCISFNRCLATIQPDSVFVLRPYHYKQVQNMTLGFGGCQVKRACVFVITISLKTNTRASSFLIGLHCVLHHFTK